MPPKGTFTDTDPSEVVDLLDRKVLGKGGLGRLLQRIDGVVVRPTWPGGGPRTSMRTATEAGIPQASISRPGLTKPGPSVFFSPGGDTSQDQARATITAANLTAPEARSSFGQYLYDFPAGTTGSELVEFAIGALRALGAAPADGTWEFIATVPDD